MSPCGSPQREEGQQSLCLRHFPLSGGRPPSAGCSGPLGSCSMPPDHPATVRFPGGSAAGAGDSVEISPELEKINVQKEKKNIYKKTISIFDAPAYF